MAEPTSSGTAPAAGVACSHCAASNPVEHVFCGSCGGRLVIDLTDDARIPGQRQPDGVPATADTTGAAAGMQIPKQELWPSAEPGQAVADEAAAAPAPAQEPMQPQWPAEPQWPVDAQWPADPQWPAEPQWPADAAGPAAGVAPAWPADGQWQVDQQWPTAAPWQVDQQWAGGAPGHVDQQPPAWPAQGGFAEPTQLGQIPVQYQPEPSIGRPVGAPAPRLPHGWEPASFGQRLAARVIDGIVIVGLSVVFFLGVAALANALGVGDIGVGFLVGVLLLWVLMPSLISLVYRIGSDYGLGRSLGRAAVGIRLVKLPRVGPDVAIEPSDEVAHVGFGTVLGRLIVSGLGDWLFFMNSFSMLWDPQARTWGDRASNTAVVLDGAGESRSAWTPPALATALAGVLCFGLVLLSGTGPSLNDVSTTTTSNSDPGPVFTEPSSGPTSDTVTPPPDSSPPSSNDVVPSDPNAGTDPDNSQNTQQVPGTSGSSSYPLKSDVYVRSGPSRGASQLSLLPAGTGVTVACQEQGDYVTTPTGASSWWDRLSGPVSGWVSDEYVATNTTGTNDTIAPAC